jgi:regulator of cell morphogenesis and NO signaling
MLPSRLPTVDPGTSVNDVLRRWPAAVTALNAFGVDTCCGGGDSLTEAAAQAGVSVDDLIGAITEAIGTEQGEQ